MSDPINQLTNSSRVCVFNYCLCFVQDVTQSRSHTGNIVMHVAMQCSHARSHAILQYYSHTVMQSVLF